jgi:hypothetical protein
LRPEHFLVDSSGNAIYHGSVEKINPDVVYRIIGPGLNASERGLSMEQVWDLKVFERKAFLAVKSALEKTDPGVTELSRVLLDDQGKDVAEWEGIFQMSDGCIVFLEAKYRMTLVSILFHLSAILLTKLLCKRRMLTSSQSGCRIAFGQ